MRIYSSLAVLVVLIVGLCQPPSANASGSCNTNGICEVGENINNCPSDCGFVAFEKAFSPASINLGGTSILTFTITNTSPGGLTGLNFADAYPAGATNSSPLVVGGTCGSITQVAAAGGSSFNLTGATIGASTTCTVTVEVTASTAGTKNNTTGVIGSTESGAGTDDASATLTVTTPPTPVPILPIWAFVGLSGLIIGLVGLMRRRKHRTG